MVTGGVLFVVHGNREEVIIPANPAPSKETPFLFLILKPCCDGADIGRFRWNQINNAFGISKDTFASLHLLHKIQ